MQQLLENGRVAVPRLSAAATCQISACESRGRRFGADPGRALGEHPVNGGAVVAKHGRYGPYVSHNGVNATLPSDKTPEAVTLEDAVALIDAKAGNAPSKRPVSRSRKAGAQKARGSSKSRSAGSTPAAPTAQRRKTMRSRKAAKAAD